MRTVATLCIIHEGERVLLGMKKRGFGEGRFNGFGGKVGEGESIEDAAVREVQEEAGIEPLDMVKVGELLCTFADRPDEIEAHIFKARRFVGVPTETEEMRPQWFGVEEIPFAEMWSDDEEWFPLFLRDQRFTGTFHFDQNDAVLKSHVKELP